MISARAWRGFFMKIDPTQWTLTSSIRPHTLKRSFALAHAYNDARDYGNEMDSHPSNGRLKVPRLLDRPSRTPLNRGGSFGASSDSQSSSRPSPARTKNRGRSHAVSSSHRPHAPQSRKRNLVFHSAKVLEPPLHSQTYLRNLNSSASNGVPVIKPAYEENPKGSLGNFCNTALGRQLKYVTEQGRLLADGKESLIYRTHVVVDFPTPIIGIGDHPNKKESEKLAALSAIYQLHRMGVLENLKIFTARAAKAISNITLSDSTLVNAERARLFMDYYCQRYGFQRPEIALEEICRKGSTSWEAVMSVNGQRIGLGSGSNKKDAQTASYLDATQYLESSDPELWRLYMEDVKLGRDLRMAPKVKFPIGHILDNEIRVLCNSIEKTTLYKRSLTCSDKVESHALQPPHALRESLQPACVYLARKSEQLAARRRQYLKDSRTQKMRTSRTSLPVFARSEEILAHIRDNDITICMASTGSGKSTQIPQLILDEYIQRGEGAHCNIICTQPRRIAAISVADRVAKERGETIGNGSVGYQVRFEAKLPEQHGSITFCTTGVFLKKMQSALLGMSNYPSASILDHVTHVIVDEVHERDVDTDLVLVVLKRLMQRRKEMKRPLKIILMSATIDPSLFQEYFSDEGRAPIAVKEISGRSFPVTRYFMEDFIPQLSSRRDSDWVFAQSEVIKYLRREVGICSESSSNDLEVDDDIGLPYPLLALTVSHVLEQSESGHVLVFLPGWEEIAALRRCLLSPLGTLGPDIADNSKFRILVLHSSVPLEEQQVVFEPSPQGVRRIILATNIAETSVTIPDVVYVVDSGKVKEKRYDPERHMSSLVSAWVGSSNLNQRAGRAGRHRSGEYFAMMGRKRAESLHPYQTVEMKRVDLSNVVMHVKALDFPGMSTEEVLAATVEPPSAERISAAMVDLQRVGALDDMKNLTHLGRVLLQLPVDVEMGRLVVYGCLFRCLDKALTLAAILSNRDPFVSPMHAREEAAAVKNFWTPKQVRSDAFAALAAFEAWWTMQSRGEYAQANRFCSKHFLSKQTLLLIQKIKEHILRSLNDAGVIEISTAGRVSLNGMAKGVVPPELNINCSSFPILTALIALTSQPRFSIRTGELSHRTSRDLKALIHPSSVNNPKRVAPEQASPENQIYAYAEKRQNLSTGVGQMYLITTTRLDPMSYMLFGASSLEVARYGLICDGWLPIASENIQALAEIKRLKSLLNSCMLRVFEGIASERRLRVHKQPLPVISGEEAGESLDEIDGERDYCLSAQEVQELNTVTHQVVSVLNRCSREWTTTLQSNMRFRPADSAPNRSGRSTPLSARSASTSRAGTPRRMSYN